MTRWGSLRRPQSGEGRRLYRVYGLLLSSNTDLPGLRSVAEAGAESVVLIELGYLPSFPLRGDPWFVDCSDGDHGDPHLIVHRCGPQGCYYLRYDTGMEFVVDAVRGAVWGRWGEGFGAEDAALYLLGPVLGYLLRIRGTTCLHAGAIVEGGTAFALVGPSGIGKSTLTATLAEQGCTVLTDDVLPVIDRFGRIEALPGYPRLRLRSAAVEHLYGHPDAKPLLTPNWDKRFLDLDTGDLRFNAHSVPLGAIYLLKRDDRISVSPSIARIGGHEGLTQLAANTYRNELLSPEMRRDELVFLAGLMRQVPVRRLEMRSDLSALKWLAHALLDDFRALGDV